MIFMKKLTTRLLSLVLLGAFIPSFVLADSWYLENGDITIKATSDTSQTVTQGENSKEDSNPTISNWDPNGNNAGNTGSTSNTIIIEAAAGAKANVTLENVNIDVSSNSEAAITTQGQGDVTLNLSGNNSVQSGEYHAGIHKENTGNLTVTTPEGGTGSLNATGGKGGAGIGGGDSGIGENITITDGEVTAAGGTNGAGIGGGLRKNGEKITVSGDATLKVQGGPTDAWDGAGAGIGNGGSHNGEFSGSFIPVNGAETEPDTSNLTTGKIEYYAPGADMTKDEPTSTILGSGQPTSPGETAAPVEYRMQTSASEPVQGNGKSTGYKAPVQGHFYQVVGQDGKAMIFATAQKKDVLAIATDSDFAMLTGKMEDIEALRKQGVRRIIFATKRATSTFLLSELLEKRAYGEIWSLIHDGENVAFTAVEKKMDISSILTRLQTK